MSADQSKQSEVEAVAQALFDRLCDRCFARGHAPHHPRGTRVRDMPPSYRDDYYDDARAVIEAMAIGIAESANVDK